MMEMHYCVNFSLQWTKLNFIFDSPSWVYKLFQIVLYSASVPVLLQYYNKAY